MKNLKFFIAFAIMLCIFVSCENAPAKNDSKANSPGMSGDCRVTVYVDPETGVNYLHFHFSLYDGFVTPRYNADGSLMVTK